MLEADVMFKIIFLLSQAQRKIEQCFYAFVIEKMLVVFNQQDLPFRTITSKNLPAMQDTVPTHTATLL